jgi:hypothetical protein
MGNENYTLPPFTDNDAAEVSKAVLNQLIAQRNRIALDLAASGANFQPGWLSQAATGGIDEGFVFAPDLFTDLFTTGQAYVSGAAAQRNLCISQTRSDANGQTQYQDAIIITHLAVEAQSPIVLADLVNISEDCLIDINSTNQVQRPNLVRQDRLIDWLTVDMAQVAALRNVTAGAGTGRDIFNFMKYGIWEGGLRRLPRPIFIPEGQFGNWVLSIRTGGAPSATSGCLLRSRFRYHRLRGVSGK